MDKTDNWDMISVLFVCLYLSLDYFEKDIVKKCEKQQVVNIICRILRPKIAFILNFWDHISIVSFSQSFIFVWTPNFLQSLSSCKFGLKISNLFLIKKNKKNKKIKKLVKTVRKKMFEEIIAKKQFFFFFFWKYINSLGL